MTQHINLNAYQDFVQEVTSKQSNNTADLVDTINKLQAESGVNVALLTTGGFGLGSEGGEVAEIVKKCLFQGKPLDEATIFHIKRELGDVIWYWVNTCRAINVDPNEVIAENVRKLESRYPGGSFDPYYSENRKAGDL